jgi:tetratricopeptide (TPR) repeat protein
MPASSSASERAASVSDRKARRLRLRLVILAVVVGLAAGAGIVVRPHVRAWYHRRAARRELQRYHNRLAIRHLLVCRAIWPRDPESLLLAARAARRARVYGDSERLLRTYREIRGRDDAYTFEHLLLDAECRVDEFAVPCWKCVEEGRYNAPLLMEALTRGYLRQYRLRQAQLCLERWKQEQPDNAQLFYLEGLLNFDYLHSSSAVDSYRRAVELDADHEEARLGLAVTLMHSKDFTEAAEHFRRLLQAQPDNARLQVGLAECLDGLGESAEAAQLVEDVLARQPQFAPALSLHGQLALESEHLAQAETSLRQALRQTPWDHRVRYSLIQCLEKSGQKEEARQQQQQLQQMEQDLARFHKIVTKEMPQRPNDPALHCTLGQLLLRSGRRAEGIRWFHNALRLDPRYAPARQALADCLSQANSEAQPDPP